MKRRFSSITLLNVILLVTLSIPVYGSVYNKYYGDASPISAETPKVILQQGTTGNSTIYANKTSALVSVWTNQSAYDYVLKVTNQVADNWKMSLRVYGSSNIGRISDAIIEFHDGTSSNQIIIQSGSVTQSEGSPYDLTNSATICISISNLQATTIGTSYLCVYLKILVPNISTYNLLIIVFEIT